MCVLIPLTEDIGPRITDSETLRQVLDTKGKPQAVTEMARALGKQMSWPKADHFHVPVRPGTSCAALLEDGQMVCFLAAWEPPNAIAHRPVEAEGRNGSGGATGCAAGRDE